MKRLSVSLVILLIAQFCVVGCQNGGKTHGGDDDGDGDGCSLASADLASGVTITNVDLYQTVRIQLMENGSIVEDAGIVEKSEVVAGKDALVRIHVLRDMGCVDRTVYARVDLHSERDPCPVEQEFFLASDSKVEDLNSTLNVRIPAKEMTEDLGITVSIREPAESEPVVGDASGAQWPAGGDSFDLMPKSTEGPLKVVIVPVRYNADGSGRLPGTSDEMLELYEKELYFTYPAGEIAFTIAEPFDWNETIGWDVDDGWSDLLSAVTTLRSQSGASPDEYYYGLVAPGDSWLDFAGLFGGSVLGLSHVATSPGDDWARVSVGLGFPDEVFSETMAHELGHAHGRFHAPNGGAGNPDPDYPYPDGVTGVWGYNLVTEELKSPDLADFMGYGGPPWVSDYTYNALLERIVEVNLLTNADMAQGEAYKKDWKSVLVSGNGTMRAGPSLRVRWQPGGEVRIVEFYDIHGEMIDVVDGYVSEFDCPETYMVVFPVERDDVSFVRIVDNLELVPLQPLILLSNSEYK